jgi:hypothetical protein
MAYKSFRVAVGLSAALSSPALSQAVLYPPAISLSDDNGVDLVSGRVQWSQAIISIGPQESKLSDEIFLINSDIYPRYYYWPSNGVAYASYYANQPIERFTGGILLEADVCGLSNNIRSSMVSIGSSAVCFQKTLPNPQVNSWVFTPRKKNGDSLIQVDAYSYRYTDRNGSVYYIDNRVPGGSPGYTAKNFPHIEDGLVKSISYPNGVTEHIVWEWNFADAVRSVARISSVWRNDGFQLKFNYRTNNPAATYDNYFGWGTWTMLESIQATNMAIERCNTTLSTCSLSMAWPTATLARTVLPTPARKGSLSVTDSLGGLTRYTYEAPSGSNLAMTNVTSIKPSWSSVDFFKFEQCEQLTSYCSVKTYPNSVGQVSLTQVTQGVKSATRDGRVWNYDRTADLWIDSTPVRSRNSSIDPDGRKFTVNSYLDGTPTTQNRPDNIQKILQVDYTNGSFASFFNNIDNNLQSENIERAESNLYEYDLRGNVTKITAGGAFSTASYTATCADVKICNKPTSITDRNGRTTDFTYDPTHGNIMTETGPLVNGVRPQKRYRYVLRNAWFKNDAGAMTRSTEPIWKLDSVSFCRSTTATLTGCAVTSDETVTKYEYGPDSGPNNLLLRGIIVTADGLSLRTCYSYDRFGNRISETQPLANLASCP